MKLFLQWCRLHKIKFALLVICAIACGFALCSNLTLGFVFLALLYGVWAVIYTLDTNNFLSLLIAAGLLSAPATRAQKFEPAAPLVIGGIVVIVAAGLGFVGCKAVKRCNKIAKGREHQLTNESPFRVAGEAGEYGAFFAWSEPGYCAAERLVPVAPTVFTLTISVQSASNATVTCTASTGHEFVQSWESFTEELAGHGLAVTAGLNHSSYERNRHPVHAEQVPIAFNFATRTATVGRGDVLVTVERSTDLREWNALCALNVEAGSVPLRIEDASSGAQFYRVTTKGMP